MFLILILASFSKNDGFYNNNDVYINKTFENKLKVLGFDDFEIANLTAIKAHKLSKFNISKTVKFDSNKTPIKKKTTTINGSDSIDQIKLTSYASYDDTVGNLGIFYIKNNVSLSFAASHHFDVLSISFDELNELKYTKINNAYVPDIEFTFRYDEVYYKQVVGEPTINKTKTFNHTYTPNNSDKYYVANNYVSVEFKLPTNYVINLGGYGVNVEQYSYRNFHMTLEAYFYPKITKPSTVKFLAGFVHDDSVLSRKTREVLDGLTLSINTPYFSFGKTLSKGHFENLIKTHVVLPFQNI